MTELANGLPRVLFVTGTDTGVGKTIVSAALVATLTAARRSVAYYKPTQAGLEDDGGDSDCVRRLTGLDAVCEGIRLSHPMAPVAAAALAGATLPDAGAHTAAIEQLAAENDHVIVEGAGGLLVQLDQQEKTIADIAATATARIGGVGILVVCRAALGTLNHTELTVEAIERRNLTLIGLIIGSWPEHPTDIDLSNHQYFSAHRLPLLGVVPENAGRLGRPQFEVAAPRWLRTGRPR